jgi:cysteine desulfurase
MNHPVYLDYCATTPVHPDVRAAMQPALEDVYGNPSSMHWAGRQAAELVRQARQQVAESVGCIPAEVYFTSGATEADNLALFGTLHRYEPAQAHLITTAVEHHAILHAAEKLARQGYSVTIVPVDGHGRVDPQAVRKAIRKETRLISVMLVNNEVGTIQPVAEIGLLAREAGILLHTDAVQGIGLPDLGLEPLNADLLSLSGHKIYGPKGIGALILRQGTQLEPLVYGGAQERSLRPGTENVVGIIGLGAAMQLIRQHRQEQHHRLKGLRTYLSTQLYQRIPGTIVNGPEYESAPHVLSVSFPGADGEMILIRLNGAGFAVSLGSACTSQSIEPSHVLTAMGIPPEQVDGTLRISLGYPTTQAELDALLAVLPDIVARARI